MINFEKVKEKIGIKLFLKYKPNLICKSKRSLCLQLLTHNPFSTYTKIYLIFRLRNPSILNCQSWEKVLPL
jgi:hypothetical protein